MKCNYCWKEILDYRVAFGTETEYLKIPLIIVLGLSNIFSTEEKISKQCSQFHSHESK